MDERGDNELLENYARTGSADAFGELVRRHGDMVYSAALRRVGRDAHLADDVTQATFTLLSQRAGRLKPSVVLAGWLYNAAGYAARSALRGKARRQRHEGEAASMRSETSDHPKQLDAIERQELLSHLDAAMDRLRESDRRIVLLSYFEKRSHEDVGRMLGISAAAATKRLSRAIERLRRLLTRHQPGGGLHDAGALLAALASHAVGRAPADVLARAAKPSASAIAKGAATMMMLTKLKVAALICVTLAAGVVAAATAARWIPQVAARVPASSGYAIVANWEIAVPPDLADAVRRMGKLVPTDSKSYDAYLCDRQALQRALQTAMRDKAVLAYSWPLKFLEPRQMQGWPDGMSFGLSGMGTLNPGPTWVPFFLTVNGTFKLESRRDAVRLTITTTEATARLRDVRLAGSFQFAGDVPLDKTLVFVGHVGQENGQDVHVIAAWQPVPCAPAQVAYVTDTSSVSDWLRRGADAAVAAAADALAWNQSAHSPDVPQPRWTRTLDNGVIVKLVAVSTAHTPPYAWWDADGVSVALGAEWRSGGDSADGSAAVLDVRDPTRKGRGRGMNGGKDGMEYQDLGEVVRAKVAVESVQKFSVGVAGGDGTIVGTLKVGDKLDVAGVHCQIDQVKPGNPHMANLPGSAWVEASYTQRPDLDVIIVPVDAAGVEHWDHLPDLRGGKPDGGIAKQTLIAELAADEIDHFVVRTRPRAWTTFEGVAAKSTVMASEKPAPAASSTQPAPGTPESTMNVLADAIEAGDIAAARRCCDGDATAQPVIDATLANLIAAAQLRRAVADRFGDKELSRLIAAAALNLPDPRAMRHRRFTVDGDVAKEIPGPHERLVGPPSVRRIRGQWKWTVQIPPGTDPAMIKASVEQETQRARALASVAKAVRDGKYADADAMADDLRRRLAAPGPAAAGGHQAATRSR